MSNRDPLYLDLNSPKSLSVGKWEMLVDELRLTQNTLNRVHLSEDESPRLGIGTSAPQAPLQIIHKNQNSNGGSLILGPTTASNLRMGYHQDYSWVQSHGSKPLAINPVGNNVGIRTAVPESPLHVHGRIESSKDGFKFPDGSVQKRASGAIVVKTGHVIMNKTGSYQTSPLADGRGRTYTSPYVNLSGFTAKPQVMFSISHLDSYRGKNTRIKVTIVELSAVKVQSKIRTRFKVKFDTWSDSSVYQCVVRWMAIGV